MLSQYAQQTMVDTMPIAACVFIGPEHIISAANELMLAKWNKDDKVFGIPQLEALPESTMPGFHDLLDKVYQSGEQYHDHDGMAFIQKDGQLQPIYFDFALKPIRDINGNIYGVVNTSVDTSAKVADTARLYKTVEQLATANEELRALNEEYQALNEELEAGSEELRAMNEELLDTRKQLEKSVAALADSEERLLLAAEAVNLGMYDQDLLTQKVITSQKLDSIFGVSGRGNSKVYTNTIHPEDVEIRDQAMERSMKTGRLFYEVRLLKDENEITWIRAEGKVLYDNRGKPVRLLGTVLDFTEERQSKDIQRKLMTLVENSADLMSLLDLDGKYSYINQAGKSLLGFQNDDQVAQTHISELHTPEDFQEVKKQILPIVMKEGTWLGTMRVRHLLSGEIFPVLNYTVRIDDPTTGKVIGIGAIMRDLRPEFKAKRELADSEFKLRNVTSAAPIALWMANKNGKITYVNQTWIDWTGQNLGKSWLHAIAADDQERVMAKYRASLVNQQPFEAEFRISDDEGRSRWFSATGKPQFDSAGHFCGFVGACSDITSQMELQQQKDDFIGIASHELKTPVTSLKASVQLLSRFILQPDNPLVPKLLQQAGRSVDRVSSLIEDLLNVTKLEQKEMRLNKTTFVVAELLESCINSVVLPGSLEINIAGDVSISVIADEHRIDQVVTNLLTNAIKYAPNSQSINVEVVRIDDFVKISVLDHGPGISKDHIEKLFERFYRVDHMVQHISGLGLGLYISAEIIRRHGGQIGAESEIGFGSTFWFTIPLN